MITKKASIKKNDKEKSLEERINLNQSKSVNLADLKKNKNKVSPIQKKIKKIKVKEKKLKKFK